MLNPPLTVLHAPFHFLLLAGIEGTGIGIAEVAADAASHGDSAWFIVATNSGR